VISVKRQHRNGLFQIRVGILAEKHVAEN